ncbi:DUF3566 domain-containing protein [Kocuria sp. JC486]|uniref:DUF3566 domain-containing protein n=1 Tax=Kocuria soli TaxID=2485125 RepID=A0A3N3ZUR9_9MICC|nr:MULTISPECIES: DUF3566 domain-containing protein [Kocuria]NHU84916.1 DUF3566 domain-containing protein [Kocuria sp. JC486]ROZ64219.1 DUF3566 domain-containing protein [Kocuria soli]
MSPKARSSTSGRTTPKSTSGAKAGSASGSSSSGQGPAGAGTKVADKNQGKSLSKALGRGSGDGDKSGKAANRPSTKGLVRPAPRAKVRRARLVVSKVDTWSVLKLAFLLSVALGIITLVAAVLLWILMDITGLFNGINELMRMLAGPEGSTDIREVVSLGQVAVVATVFAVINVILLTLLSVLGAVLYNLAAGLIGGIGLTLTDD